YETEAPPEVQYLTGPQRLFQGRSEVRCRQSPETSSRHARSYEPGEVCLSMVEALLPINRRGSRCGTPSEDPGVGRMPNWKAEPLNLRNSPFSPSACPKSCVYGQVDRAICGATI